MIPQPLLVPFHKLVASPANVRRVKTDLAPLVASLRSDGILQSLVVVPRGDGRYEVVAGERRRRAAAALVKEGTWPRDVAIPCEARAPAEAIALSIAENAERVAMHPADAYRAFAALAAKGHDATAIAHRYGFAVGEVEKLLRLGRLDPKALKALAEDRIDVAFAQALTLTDDAELQLAVLKRAGSAAEARRLLTQTKVATSHRLFRFVAEAYASAGGPLTGDLFGDEAYADDPELVQRLADERLARLAAAARAEGWGEVLASETERDDAYRLERLQPAGVREPTSEEAAALAAARAEVERLEGADGDPSVDARGRLSEQRRVIAALERDCRCFTPDQKAQGLLLISIDYEGGVRTTAHCRKVSGAETGKPAADRPLYAAALVEDLSKWRTRALQIEVARRPALAADILLDALLGLMTRSGGRHAVQLRVEGFRLDGGEGLGVTPVDAPDSLVADLMAAIPAAPADRWTWLEALATPDKARLTAVAAASLVNGLAGRFVEPERGAAVERVAAAAGLDMAAHWRPSVAFFERLTKRACLAALEEGVGPEAAANCAKLGKADLAVACAERLAATAWLPAPLKPAASCTSCADAPVDIAA